MSDYFPRVETIVVPANVKPAFIGRYASFRASEILSDCGLSCINRKSVLLRPTSDPRMFHLVFEGIRVVLNDALKEEMFEKEAPAQKSVEPNPITPVSKVVLPAGVAGGYKKRPVKTDSSKGA